MKTKMIALSAALLASGSVFAQAVGETTLDINLTGELAILSYYSTLQVDLPLTQLAPTGCTADTANDFECATAALQTATATVSGGNINAGFTAPPAPTFPVVLTNAPLILQNVWAVRSIGGATANATLAVTQGNVNLTGPGASAIGIIAAAVQSAGSTNDDTATITFADPGLVVPRVGNVRLNLDLTNATRSGVHAAAGSEYTLTLTNI
jgi:hypothetical protein